MKDSIRYKLTISVLFITIIPMFLALGLFYFQRIEALKLQTFEKLTMVRDLKSLQIDYWFDECWGSLNILTQVKSLRDLSSLFENLEERKNYLSQIHSAEQVFQDFVHNYSSFYEISLVDIKTKDIVVSSNFESIGYNYSNSSIPNKLLTDKKRQVSEIFYSVRLKKPVIIFSAPIYSFSKDEKPFAMLFIHIDLENSLYSLLKNRTGLGKTGETFIVSREAVVLSELRWRENAPLQLRISAEASQNASKGLEGIIESRDYRNEKVLAAYSFIYKMGCGIVAKQDKSEIQEFFNKLLFEIVVIFIVSVAIIVFITKIWADKMMKPLKSITGITKEMQEGNFLVRNKVSSKDEFGMLAEAFNKMADSIYEQMSIQKIESEISTIIINTNNLDDFRKLIFEKLMNITDSRVGAYFVLNENIYELRHSVGIKNDFPLTFQENIFERICGKTVSTKNITYFTLSQNDSMFVFKTFLGEILPKEAMVIPFLAENLPKGLIMLASLNEYSVHTKNILSKTLTWINTAFSNLYTSEEAKMLNEKLKSKNEQLNNQKEILQIQTQLFQEQTEKLQFQQIELVSQNRELEIQRVQIEEANKLKSEFLTNMSHELRTPLNSIIALTRVLELQTKEKLSDEEVKYLQIIDKNSKELLRLINDILDLSKIEAGKMEYYIQPTDIKMILNGIIEGLTPLADEKHLSLYLEVPENIPNFETDPMKLQTILRNIISNGVKFTQTGYVKTVVNVENQEIRIKVIDTGIGISEKSIPYIFDEFRQGDGSYSRRFEGTGLGLAIVKKLVAALNGTVEVKSKINAGSIFTLTFPLIYKK